MGKMFNFVTHWIVFCKLCSPCFSTTKYLYKSFKRIFYNYWRLSSDPLTSGQQQGQSVSLEDLLHKPVARVQKNSLSLQDLLKHTPEGSADHAALSESLHLIQNFLNEYNLGMPHSILYLIN